MARYLRSLAMTPLLAILGLLAACGPDVPGYLDQEESRLGMLSTWYGTDHRVFHASLLYPYGLGLRTSGYVVGIEKGAQDKVGGAGVNPGFLVAERPDDTQRFREIRGRLEGDEKAHVVTHVIRYEAESEPKGHVRISQCMLYAALKQSPPNPRPGDAAGRLFDECPMAGAPESTAAATPVPSADNAFASSWTAIDDLRRSLTADLTNPHSDYTHVLVVVMGWNTAQADAMQNFNSLVGHLLDEAAARKEDFNPLIVGVTWPSQWAVGDWVAVPPVVVRGLSFFNKADDAEEVGATWLREVISHAVLPARDDAARENARTGNAHGRAGVVLLGHSFGARALVASLTQRPQLQAPKGTQEEALEPRDPVILLEGAFEIERLYDRDRTIAQVLEPRSPEHPFSAGDPTVTLTASTFDTAVSAAIWGWYAGDIRTFDKMCEGYQVNSAVDGRAPWRGLDRTSFGCGLARSEAEGRGYGFGLCIANDRKDVPIVPFSGRRFRYYDASSLINCTPAFAGGGAHSDIFRRETARFMLDVIDEKPWESP